jgi:hypothetical protein
MYRPAPRPLMLVSPPGVAASYRRGESLSRDFSILEAEAPMPGDSAARMAPPVYLQTKLTRPLPTKDGGTLRTVLDARTYMLGLSKDRCCANNGNAPASCYLPKPMSAPSATRSSWRCFMTPGLSLHEPQHEMRTLSGHLLGLRDA